MGKIKIGILGCGMIGSSFLAQALKHPKYEVVGVCDRNPSRQRAALQLAAHLQVFLSAEQLFCCPNVQAIIVCTRHSDHSQHAIDALNSKKHVLIEKPIATNLQQLNSLVQCAVGNPSCVITALPHNELSIIHLARQLSLESYLGKLIAFHSYLDVPGPPRSNWYYSSEAVGGASLDTLPYALLRLFALTKANVRHAYGFKNQLIKRRRCLDGGQVECGVDDNATLILEIGAGQQAVVRSSWNTASAEDYLVVKGRKGELWVDCWKQHLILISPVPPQLDYCEVLWQGQKGYLVQAPSFEPEKSKLDVFANNIEKGKGNFFEVNYAMRVLLTCFCPLELKPELPKPFYQDNETLSNIFLSTDYL